MKSLDLFSGIGAFALAGSWYGVQTTQFVEIDPFPQKVLTKNFPGVPIHDDITTFFASLGQFDIITAGFPCQDLSSANPNGRGLEGKRSGLFFEVVRLLRAIQPRFLILENVPALINRGLDRVLWELAESGFDAEWQIISSASVGAPHRRERLFIIAYPQGNSSSRNCRTMASSTGKARNENDGAFAQCCGSTSPNSESERSPGSNSLQGRPNTAPIGQRSFWQQSPHPEPTICRMDDGVSRGLAKSQLKALGNSINPYCAAIAFERIMEIEKANE